MEKNIYLYVYIYKSCPECVLSLALPHLLIFMFKFCYYNLIFFFSGTDSRLQENQTTDTNVNSFLKCLIKPLLSLVLLDFILLSMNCLGVNEQLPLMPFMHTYIM